MHNRRKLVPVAPALFPAYMRRTLGCLALFVFACAPLLYGEVRLPVDAPACVRWAAGNVGAALRSAGIDPATASIEVLLPAGAGDPLPRSISAEEQSFSLEETGGAVTIRAGGAVGAMYGLEELEEQIRNRPARSWRRLTAGLVTGTQRPYLEVRADNMFIHTSGTMEAPPPGGYPLLLNDLDMWRSYIDMLARNRYNLLDLHGAYDLESTSFPNLYPMLVHVPEYPSAGDPAAQRRNLASLRAIVAYARSRGIRVALMNYSANNGRSGQYKNEPSVTGVPPERLADYTAKAVALLIRALPDLYELGFRVGESTQPASFYQDAYLKGIADAGRANLRLYTRSWQTTKAQLLPIARAAHNGFDIEIKFNGEHLGLPYQSMQGAEYGSYSYQDYLDVPADYRILWQIRANGTHRFWAWENTGFIRRTVRSCKLGDALGFTLEPHIAYFSVHPDQYYRSASDVAVYRWMWQKHWMWYYAWGQLGYNPDLPERNLIREFERHLGAAGAAAYAAMQESSRIVPLAYAYRFQGPDQRDFSPETETGSLSTSKKHARHWWPQQVLPDDADHLLQFAENRPEDNRGFAGIDEYVGERMAGTPDGRIDPFTVARRMADAARNTRALLAAAPPPPSTDAGAWRLLRVDLLAAADLGDYYAARIRGMAYLDYALRTGNEHDYSAAITDLARSRAFWQQLAETADAVYRPLSNPLRHQIGFQWSSQNQPLAQLDASAPRLWLEHRTQRTCLPLEPRPASDAAFGRVILKAVKEREQVAAGSGEMSFTWNAAIQAGSSDRSASIASATLFVKPLPSERSWEIWPMARKGGIWQATVPLDEHGLMYMVELHTLTGETKNFPDVFQETPWRMIPPFLEQDDSWPMTPPPTASHNAPR